MIHILLLLICILSVEILIRLKYLDFLAAIINLTRKVVHILPENKISDHWKEKVIPAYAMKIMKSSILMFLIILLILSLFFIMDYFISGFLDFSLSLVGVVEAVIFACGYVWLRKSFV